MINNSFKYIHNLKKPLSNNNFILSALNLSFLAYFFKKKIIFDSNYILWPDGIYGAKLLNCKKISGSELISKIKLANKIQKVIVIGNLDSLEKKFLIKKFKKKVEHINLPYKSEINFFLIKKRVLKFTSSDLILITLPTPKQEKLAASISRVMQNSRIICIGGGLSIASGRIKKCPKFLFNLKLEWLWRLRTDTVRRIFRLFKTFYTFNYYKLFKKAKISFQKS